ncbi:MAG: PAAR domain-containing protein [Myxococcales bacterium]|nr:PAAR domain-containing protein [Myxococcales bacterium]
MTPAAARVDDPIVHNIFAPALKRIGFEVGVTVEVLLIVGTGGWKKGLQVVAKVGGRGAAKWLAKKVIKEGAEELAEEAAEKSLFALGSELLADIADVLDGAVVGHWLGGTLGGGLDYCWNALAGLFGSTGGMTTGSITKGAAQTYVEGKAAARMRDPVKCEGNTTMVETVLGRVLSAFGGLSSGLNAIANGLQGDTSGGTAHIGMNVAQGSLSVYIEGLPAARVGDKTKCDAVVSKGARAVGFGGIRITAPESAVRNEEGDGVAFGMHLASFAWVLSIFGTFGKGVDKLRQNPEPTFTIWDVWRGTSDGRSFWLKMLGIVPEYKDAASVADRYQKIRTALKEGKSMAEAMKGIELTGGKVVRSIATAGGGQRFLDDKNHPIYEIRPNEEVVIYQPDKVTEADVRKAQAERARAKERKEIETRQMYERETTPPRWHPGMGGRR